MLLKRFFLICGLLLFLGVSAGLVACTGNSRTSINVNICNNAKEPIKNIICSFNGGEIKKRVLARTECYSDKIIPTGESSLEITYEINGQSTISKNIDTYFERGYQGTIELSINGHNDISVDINLSVGQW